MKIGLFDSGFGGLTIYKKIRETLPQYDYIYLGDNARTPYGNRSFEAILEFTTQGVDFLFQHDCKLIIIACNTASAKALRTIQQNYLRRTFPDCRVLGIIRPSVEELGHYSRTRTVALWGTEGTVKSLSFQIEMQKYFPDVHLIQQACPLLVPLVEAGELSGEGVNYFVRKYWEQTAALSNKIDTLLLACTHYPLIFDSIRDAVPAEIKIILQADIVAPSLQDYLNRHREIEQELSKSGSQIFLTTDQTQGFDRLAEIFLGHPVVSKKINIA
ncbi:MAG TPA: glutamate racemase [Acidobacteriota bacterium]|nr:glutamate racemase [Acidobacteriota bacterium]